MNKLILLLNADLQYIKWKQSVEYQSKDMNQEEQNAEKCIFQLEHIIENNGITDCQVKKLADVRNRKG
jgi:hypothetical protein